MSPRARTPNRASQDWNQGGVPGSSYVPGRKQQANVPVTPTCTTEGCGIAEDVLDEGDPTVWGWILVRVNGSLLKGRWFCAAACAYHGMALAEIRMRPDGDPC